MVEVEDISDEEAEEEFAKVTERGKWSKILDTVVKGGGAVKISGLKRGQVAAVGRRAKELGLEVKTSYKNGYIVIRK